MRTPGRRYLETVQRKRLVCFESRRLLAFVMLLFAETMTMFKRCYLPLWLCPCSTSQLIQSMGSMSLFLLMRPVPTAIRMNACRMMMMRTALLIAAALPWQGCMVGLSVLATASIIGYPMMPLTLGAVPSGVGGAKCAERRARHRLQWPRPLAPWLSPAAVRLSDL